MNKVKIILHRPIPDGFQFKTATISRRADGWYINISLEDKAVPIQLINIDSSRVGGINPRNTTQNCSSCGQTST